MTAFKITRYNEYLDELNLSNTIQTGIRFVSLPGCVPVFLEVKACHAAGYQYFNSWQELEPEQQAFLIAHYISAQLVENNIKDAEIRAAKAKRT